MSYRWFVRLIAFTTTWLIMSLGTAHAGVAPPLAADPVLEARVMKIADELRCLVCQNETIAASQADLAVDLRRQIREKLSHGETESQILDFMVARYGAFVRYRPAFDTTTALLWIAPFALLVIGGLVLWNTLKAARRARESTEPTVTATARSTEIRVAGSRSLHATLAIGVPLFAVAAYAWLGNPAALKTQPAPAAVAASTVASDAEPSQEAVQAMLATLAERLKTPSGNPASDAQGWTLLGRAYASLQRFGDADRALAHAIELTPDDAQLLADRADVLTVVQDGKATAESTKLIDRALQIDPRNLKALALAGTAAFDRGDRDGARRYWQQARANVPDGSAFAMNLDRSLQEVGGSSPSMSASAPKLASDSATAAAPARITGRVSLSKSLAAGVLPTDTVFVFARAVNGPRMPLAILRRTVADLPFDFTLDDSLAMSPQTRLSGAQQVIVGARVSRSGDAMPQPGDARIDSEPVSTRSAGVQLVIAAAGTANQP